MYTIVEVFSTYTLSSRFGKNLTLITIFLRNDFLFEERILAVSKKKVSILSRMALPKISVWIIHQVPLDIIGI